MMELPRALLRVRRQAQGRGCREAPAADSRHDDDALAALVSETDILALGTLTSGYDGVSNLAGGRAALSGLELLLRAVAPQVRPLAHQPRRRGGV